MLKLKAPDSNLVSGPGFESISPAGQNLDNSAPQSTQIEVTSEVASIASGHVGSQSGQPKDTFGASACCTGVAQNDEEIERIQNNLALVVKRWHSLPEQFRVAV